MKKLTPLFLAIIFSASFLPSLLLGFVLDVPPAQAVTEEENVLPVDIRDQMIVPLGIYDQLGEAVFEDCSDGSGGKCWKIPWIANYIRNAYRYGVTLGSVLAVAGITIGGIMYMIGGLNQSLIGRGKEIIIGSVSGLLLLLGSYMILNIVNPNLVNLRPIEVQTVTASILAPTSCEAILSDDYYNSKIEVLKYEGKEKTCGDPFDIKKKPGADINLASTSCIGFKCPNNKACAYEDDTNTYECVTALLYGSLTYATSGLLGDMMSAAGVVPGGWTGIDGAGRAYLDSLSLREINNTGYDFEIADTTIDQGSATYAVRKNDDLIGSTSGALAGDSDFYLQVEVNDTVGFFSVDDTYFLDKKGKIIAVEGDQCCTYTCSAQKVSDGQDKKPLLTVNPGCEWIQNSDINGIPLEYNIDTKNYYCHGYPFAEVSTQYGLGYDRNICPKPPSALKKAGEACESSFDCASLDCDGEPKTCECNFDGDCQGGFYCYEASIFGDASNRCVDGLKGGQSCSTADQCLSEDCDSGKCGCDNDYQCGARERCVDSVCRKLDEDNDTNSSSPNTPNNNRCDSGETCYKPVVGHTPDTGLTSFKEICDRAGCSAFNKAAVACTDDNQCLSDSCATSAFPDGSINGVAQFLKLCQCDSESDCPQGFACLDDAACTYPGCLNYCTPLRKAGATCNTSNQCLSGLCKSGFQAGSRDVSEDAYLSRCECRNNQDCVDAGQANSVCVLSTETQRHECMKLE